MAQVLALKYIFGVPFEINPSNDSLAAKSIFIGGTGGTEFTQTQLNILTGGVSSDASSLHEHDSRYFQQAQFISSTSGSSQAALPVLTNANGVLDTSFINYASFASHHNLTGLTADDHPQYFNQTRGDARYFPQSVYISTSAGSGSAGLPIVLNSSGQIDPSFISLAGLNHNTLGGLQGGQSGQYYHLTSAQYTALTGGATTDASSYHEHNSLYYTKAQVDADLANYALANAVIYANGSAPFTAAQSMGGFKLTNVANGSNPQDAVAYSQLTAAEAAALQINGSNAMTGVLNMGSNKISNLAAGVAGTDAVNLNQLQQYLSGLSWRAPAKTIDTTSTALPTGTSYTNDGYTAVNGDRVLFIALSSSSSNNRVYVLSGVGSSLVWTLATDGQSGTGAPTLGDALLVTEGTADGDTQWSYNGSTWVLVKGAGTYSQGAGISIAGNVISVAFGAGITQLPTGDTGINLWTTPGLFLTTDGVNPSTSANAQLSVLLANGTLSITSGGLKVATGGITNNELAANSVATSNIQASAVTSTQIAAGAVGTTQLAALGVTASKLAAGSVTASKLDPSVAGTALALDGTTNAIDVQVDGSSIDVNGSNQVEIKALGVTTAKIAAAAVDTTKISYGTTGNGVNASALPILNANSYFTSTTVEGALNELASNGEISSVVAGEAIGQYSLIVLRRNSSNQMVAYNANCASASNLAYASAVLGDVTVNSAVYSGNDTKVQFVNPGLASQALTVSASGTPTTQGGSGVTITVSLATNGSSAITSTGAQIASAINASSAANIYVSASSTGSTPESAVALTTLSGGSSYNDNGRWEVYGMAMTAAAGGASFNARRFGYLPCSFVSAPTAAQIGYGVYLSINNGQANLSAPTNTGDGIVYLGRVVAIGAGFGVDFRAPVLRGVHN